MQWFHYKRIGPMGDRIVRFLHSGDYLNIYNVGTDGIRTFAKRVCGSEEIQDFTSQGNHVDLEFKSDGTTTYPGNQTIKYSYNEIYDF